jgi:predicted nucleic acid-binding protein
MIKIGGILLSAIENSRISSNALIMRIKKFKIYLGTTIFNFVFADDAPKERDFTRKFFQQIKAYECYISDIVIKEIARCYSSKRAKLMALIEENDLEELSLDDAAERLARRYIKEGIIPSKFINDAYHIAIASVAGMDVILSWDFDHLVKMKTKREVAGINMLMGYGPVDIFSPLEVVKNV